MASSSSSILLAIASPSSSSSSSSSIQFHTSTFSHLSFSHSHSLSSPFSSSTLLPSLSLSPAAPPTLSPPPPPTTTPLSVFCGRGDKKTARGKRFNHSFGNARPRNKDKGRGPPRLAAPPAPTKKDKFEDNEVVKIEIDESLFG